MDKRLHDLGHLGESMLEIWVQDLRVREAEVQFSKMRDVEMSLENLFTGVLRRTNGISVGRYP